MRNLRLYDVRHCSIADSVPDISESDQTSIPLIAIDSLTPSVFVGGYKNAIWRLSLDGTTPSTSSQWMHVIDLPSEAGDLVAFEYLSDQSLLTLCFADGQIYSCDVDNLAQGVELVGCVSEGVACAVWSPDAELLAMATKTDGRLLLLSRDFDPIAGVNIDDGETAGLDELVSVGWGKKETQFHGSVGKQAAVTEIEKRTPKHDWDTGAVVISWRGDAQYFALSSLCEKDSSLFRVIRVWNRECVLVSTCQPLTGLDMGLAYRPSGNWIATVVQRDDALRVAFFERNGQPHGGFSLRKPSGQHKVMSLAWNMDSSILAVWTRNIMSDIAQDQLELWTTSNYHWYLKYSCGFADRHLAAVTWDPETAMVLHLLFQSGLYSRLSFYSSTAVDHRRPSADVFVIDGVNVNWTRFIEAVIPPPMFQSTLTLPSTVCDVSLAANSNSVLATMQDGAFCRILGGAVTRFAPPPNFDGVLYLTSVLSDDQQGALCVYSQPDSPSKRLILCTLGDDCWTVGRSCEIDWSPISVLDTKNGVVVQDGQGLWYTVVISSDSDSLDVSRLLDSQTNDQIRFPRACPDSKVITIDGKLFVIGLSTSYQIFINSFQICSDVLSYCIHSDFLLLTTLQHTLKFIPLSELPKITNDPNNNRPSNIDPSLCRRVERGSRLVVCDPNGTRVVLQMPRGNVETLDPRPLLLRVLHKLIDSCAYLDSIKLMRRHRVNMNLLYDQNHKKFLENIASFVDQIDDSALLNLFIAELSDENTTLTLYPGYNSASIDDKNATKSKKIDTVCSALRGAIHALESARRLRLFPCLLATFVKQQRISSALHTLKVLMGDESNTGVLDECLGHLLWTVNADTLFDTALSTYDFNLVLLVAERSQKDPKEYLPFLNELRQLRPDYMRYRIEMHLRNPQKALRHLVTCTGMESHESEFLNHVRQNELFKEALGLLQEQDSRYAAVCASYGHSLMSKSRFPEARLMFERAADIANAKVGCQRCLDYRNLIRLSEESGASGDDSTLRSSLLVIGTKLVDQKRFTEAVDLYRNYLPDPPSAARCYAELGDWTSAASLLTSELQSLVKLLTDKHNCLIDGIETRTNELRERVTRLALVRTEKRTNVRRFLDGEADADVAESEAYSETSGATSLASSKVSAYSQRTKAARKKQRNIERKKTRLKEGSRHEDYALMHAVRQTLIYTDTTLATMTDMLVVMVQCGMVLEAKRLQSSLALLQSDCLSALTEVWPAAWNLYNLPGPLDEWLRSADGEIIIPMDEHLPQSLKLDPQMFPPSIRSDRSWMLDSLTVVDDGTEVDSESIGALE